MHGLVLAGGYSRRMGRDKALIEYHGIPQFLWTARLLSAFCSGVIISCRANQALPGLDGLPYRRIHDEVEGQGPIGGILAAFKAQPGSALLVVACDLPRLSAATLSKIMAARNPDHLATCYHASEGGLPEPLCALYETSIQPIFAASLREGRHCPRKVLLQNAGRITQLDLDDPRALDNVNEPSDWP